MARGRDTLDHGGGEEERSSAHCRFSKYGEKYCPCRASRGGQIVKAANQIIVGLTIEAIAEALVFVERSGVAPAKAREVMMGGFATSRVLEVHGKADGGRKFRARRSCLDASQGFEHFAGYGKIERRVFAGNGQVAEMYKELIARGFGDEDHSALWRVVAGDWEKDS